jgi:phenylacetate-coenzyme A ligase PaaK-like adenylate-forming protein
LKLDRRAVRALGDIARIARALQAHGRAGRSRIEAFQDERLRALVAHAYENVPFYRQLLDRHGIRPRHIQGVADLGKLPIVTKHDLRAAPAGSIVARGYDPARLITTKTSGSSGEGNGLHWDELDEDISVAGLLAGRPDRAARRARSSGVGVRRKGMLSPKSRGGCHPNGPAARLIRHHFSRPA